MNVVILNDFAYVDGGASKIALGSARALAERGMRVWLFTAVGPVDPTLRGVEGLSVICLEQPEIVSDPNRLSAALRGWWNRLAASRLRVLLESLNPTETIVHVHTWTKGLSSSVIQQATSLHFQVVLTMHDFFSVCPTGSFFLHPVQKICTLVPMSRSCVQADCDSRNYGHKLWRVGRQFVQERFGGMPAEVKHYISLSRLSQDVLVPFLPKDLHLHQVANFIEAEQAPPVDVSQSQTFSFVGRLSPEKGPLLLAKCAKQLGLDVLFVGDGPLQEELANIAPQAQFTGWLSSAQARAHLRKSRALVFPSLWYETQGLVVAEALSLGIPVIVPSTSAAREWVEDEVTGLIFRGGDVDDLAKQIQRLRNDPELASALGREGYKRYWRQPATLALHCQQLERTYRQILAPTQVAANTATI